MWTGKRTAMIDETSFWLGTSNIQWNDSNNKDQHRTWNYTIYITMYFTTSHDIGTIATVQRVRRLVGTYHILYIILHPMYYKIQNFVNAKFFVCYSTNLDQGFNFIPNSNIQKWLTISWWLKSTRVQKIEKFFKNGGIYIVDSNSASEGFDGWRAEHRRKHERTGRNDNTMSIKLGWANLKLDVGHDSLNCVYDKPN